MASTAQERANKQKLVQSYHAKIKKHEQALYAKLTVEQKGFFEMTYKSSMNIFNALTKALREGVRPSDYLQNEMRWVFGTLVPEDKKEMVLYFADNIRDYQYSMAYYRRSFRSSSYAPYAERLRSLLRSTFYSSMAGDVVASLTHTLPEDAQAYFDEFPYTPSHNPYEIASALEDEADRILPLIPPRAYKVALCVEGKQLSSEELAKKLSLPSGMTANALLAALKLLLTYEEYLEKVKEL